jgi:hypothetical protein
MEAIRVGPHGIAPEDPVDVLVAHVPRGVDVEGLAVGAVAEFADLPPAEGESTPEERAELAALAHDVALVALGVEDDDAVDLRVLPSMIVLVDLAARGWHGDDEGSVR